MIRIALLLALLGGPALAQPAPPPDAEAEARTRAKALYADGSRQYDLREYGKAIEAFRKAYDLYPEPLFLFNLGQAYRQLGDCENARGFYRNYLGKVPDADNRAQVDRFIGDMDRCVRQREEADAAARRAQQPIAPPRGISGLRLAGIITAGAGGILMVAGVKLSLDASASAREAEEVCFEGCDSEDLQEIDREGRAAERNAVVLYGIGGAALAAGAGLLIYSALRGDPAPAGASRSGPERITVTPTAGGARVWASWSF